MIQVNGENHKFLRITLGNVITMVMIIISGAALYYKFDARVTALEKVIPPPSDITQRLGSVEGKLDEMSPRVIRTETNVLWLMSNHPTGKPPQ